MMFALILTAAALLGLVVGYSVTSIAFSISIPLGIGVCIALVFWGLK